MYLSRAFSIAGAVVLVAAVLAGCGGSGGSGSVLSYHAPGYKGWPYLGRDRDNTRFAPQKQINTSNVRQLGVAWSLNLGLDQYLLENFPLVYGNTIYATTSTDEVEAINATTGKMLWSYAPEVDFSFTTGVGGLGVSTNRGVAVSDGKVYMLTFDDKLQALSQKTGEMLWSEEVVPTSSGAYEDMSPTIYDGKVFVGGSGGDDGVRGFVAAFDAKTGKKLWKFYTIPKPGTSWVCKKECGGGTVYNAPTIDTKTGVLYVGTGNPAPTLVGTERPGKNLYTDSIIALDSNTGKMLWYHQQVPHDVFAYDAEQPVVIFDTKVHGKTVEAVAEAGKSGYLFILNAKTGEPLFPRVAVVKEEHSTPNTKGVKECPGPSGGVQFAPLAFDPETGNVYVSGSNQCEIVRVTSTPTRETHFHGVQEAVPDETPSGTFTAVNVTNGKIAWQHTMPTPMLGGATATAGGVVFTGDQKGNLYAFEAKSGKELWKGNLGLAFGSAPSIYTVGGQEYVLAAVGGSALTLGDKLGQTGARLVALKLGGKPL